MKLVIANRSLMCSTLILGDFDSYSTVKKFAESLKNAITHAELPITKGEPLWTPWAPHKSEYQVLDGYNVSNYAFVMGTVYSNSSSSGDDDDDYYDADEYYDYSLIDRLKEFGFTVSENGVYNSKNLTSVVHFVMDVPTMLKRLEELLPEGGK